MDVNVSILSLLVLTLNYFFSLSSQENIPRHFSVGVVDVSAYGNHHCLFPRGGLVVRPGRALCSKSPTVLVDSDSKNTEYDKN